MDALKRRLSTDEEKLMNYKMCPMKLPSIVNSGKETKK